MKKGICLALMMGSLLFGEEKRLVMNGSLGFSVKKTDMDNKKLSEYPEDLSYGMDMALIGKFGNQTIGGILSLTYDDLKKTDIENINLNLSAEKLDLTMGDVSESPSLLALDTVDLRGVIGKTQRANKNMMLFIGRSQEKDEKYGQYSQYLGGFSIDTTINKVRLGGVYLDAKDDKNSISSSTTSPVSNQVMGLNLSIPIKEALSLDAEVCFSRYDTNTKTSGDCDQKAFKISGQTQKENLEVSGEYSYVEPNFYSAGNTSLSTDKKGGEISLEYSKGIYKGGLLCNFYDNNLDKNKSYTTRTKETDISFSLSPKRFLEEAEIEYEITGDKAKTTNRENRTLSLSVSRAFSGIDSSLSYERGKVDDKVNNSGDSKSSLYSLNMSGDIRKDLSTSLYLYSSIYNQTTKQRSDSYSVSLTYEPENQVRITPSYNFCETKEAGNRTLLERTFSLESTWYLSSKHQLIVAGREMKKKDLITPSNDYQGTQAELKLTTLF